MIRCKHCGQQLRLSRWCAALASSEYSLWTVRELAAICGCSAHRMGVAMSKLFPVRHIRLGPDGNLGRKRAIYCVWAAPFNSFFFDQPANQLRKLWREQYAQRQASKRAATRISELVSTLTKR